MTTDRMLESCARALIRYAARQAPPLLSARLEEEWLADLESRPSAWARWRLGMGCCWATRVIALEHEVAQVAAPTPAGTVTGSKTMTTYSLHGPGFLSRRTSALAVIVALHLLLIYALAAGLGHMAKPESPHISEGNILLEPRHQDLPPLPPPNFVKPAIELPRPDIALDDPTDPARIDVPSAAAEPPADAHTLAPPTLMSTRVLGGPGRGFPDSDEFFSPALWRLGQSGSAVVGVCVDQKGWLTAAPTLARTSGNDKIDEGALKLATAGSGHYRATTENGQPVSSCYAFLVRFETR